MLIERESNFKNIYNNVHFEDFYMEKVKFQFLSVVSNFIYSFEPFINFKHLQI